MDQPKARRFDKDFIEDEPLAIDLKVSGISKIRKIPLDVVGTYSFQVWGMCQINSPSVEAPVDEGKTSCFSKK